MSSVSSQKILHIVNDNLTAQALAHAELAGEILPWQDTLYEGPVIRFEDLDSLAIERAKYFAARDYGDYKTIEQAYLSRNAVIKDYRNYQHIILWFDHDLYGQLQLTQLIEWLGRQDTGRIEISQIDLGLVKQKGIHRRRISQLLPTEIQILFQSVIEVTLQQTEICRQAWYAFTNGNPEHIVQFNPPDLSTMPYLKDVFIRLAREFPFKTTGFSQTEYLIVDAVKHKNFTEDDIFAYVQSKEPVAFMSRTVFQHILQHLMDVQYPVLKKQVIEQEVVLEVDGTTNISSETKIIKDSKIHTTNYTNQVLNKWVDWIQMNGINRWIGGVHLHDGNLWRYDPISRKLNKTYV